MLIILVVCSTGLHSSLGAHGVHQSTKASHAGKKGYDWSCLWGTTQTVLDQPRSAHQSGRCTIFAICFNHELVTFGGSLLPMMAHLNFAPRPSPCWLNTELCYLSKWGMSNHVLARWVPSSGVWHCVVQSVVPEVLKDHSAFVLEYQAVLTFWRRNYFFKF